MEENSNNQNGDLTQNGQTGAAGESPATGNAGDSGSSSSGSNGSSSHGSSSRSSSCRSSSGSHSSSGHGSSSHSNSGRSSSGSGSSGSGKESKDAKISIYRRVRHKVKYYYWKYKRRFKKASRLKKAGYIVVFFAFIFLLGVTIKYALQGADNPDTTTYSYVFTTQTTVPPTTEKPAIIPPEVVTYYEINDTFKVDDVFFSGFRVELPNIVSAKPLAVKINAEMDKLKDSVKSIYNSVDNIRTYREQYNYSYDSYVKDNILFLSVFTAHGKKSSDYVTANKYYAYDFEADKFVNDSIIIKMYNLDITQILDIVNSALLAVGAAQIDNIDNVRFFVKDNGKLFADVKVNALMGGTYSELVQLT